MVSFVFLGSHHQPNFFLFSGEVCVVSGKLESRILPIKEKSRL